MDLMFSQFQPNKGSKKAKKSGSNIFSLFSQKQIQEFKEAFGMIDANRDGFIDKEVKMTKTWHIIYILKTLKIGNPKIKKNLK